jgi:hypothetical protein
LVRRCICVFEVHWHIPLDIWNSNQHVQKKSGGNKNDETAKIKVWNLNHWFRYNSQSRNYLSSHAKYKIRVCMGKFKLQVIKWADELLYELISSFNHTWFYIETIFDILFWLIYRQVSIVSVSLFGNFWVWFVKF